jgi:uncharacterized membrane protein YfhO
MPAQVRIVDYQLNEVSIEVANPADGFLVLTDTYDPGWRVRRGPTAADASAGPPEAPDVYIANHAFRAVPLPAGEHRLTFTYEPAAYGVGWRVSLATAGAVLLCVAVGTWMACRRRAVGTEKDPERLEGSTL